MRMIVDTQSNRLFKGIPLEQNYDQRGGLCQVGEGNIIVTTNPIDNDYLAYWKDLGFSLPHLLVAGPFNPNLSLSELIIQNPQTQSEIKKLVNGTDVRLEFFCIEESERQLAETLGIEPYCNFDVSIDFSRKHNFKMLCEQICLATPKWLDARSQAEFLINGRKMLHDYNGPFLAKSVDGTGGISCGGMSVVQNEQKLLDLSEEIDWSNDHYILEYLIPNKAIELSIHWQISKNGELTITDIFGQLSDNFAYAGAYAPVQISQKVRDKITHALKNIFAPALVKLGAVGFFCCDLIVDTSDDVFWIDFNPRKGAIIYVHNMVHRLSWNIFDGDNLYFFHRHCHFGQETSFAEVYKAIKNFVKPGAKPFVVITNPGVIPYGYVDITSISHRSVEEARELFSRVEETLKSYFTG